jgi:isoleucyl-tRNA synthetase
MKVLKAKGRLVKQDQEKHQYPFCWRLGSYLV